ncbi:YugN family protein [Fredinandcohnia sp. 179-A 10B2 NHS]|uniref:YugN family protein n=1 Tax=Fredinandcohnia sp. 179-A 10B2 NHS TaxID=3235176 RepID=UPI0039A3A683
MRFENAGIEGLSIELSRLTDIMREAGFILAGQWDYQRVTYDRKFEVKGEIYYLRVQGFAIEGEIEENARHTVVKLLTPLLGKYYYPHGVEYGDGETFPNSLVDQSSKLLSQVKENIEAVINA